jgi:hypothetical protein
MFEVPWANVDNFSGLENMDVITKKNAFHTTWRQENRKQHGIFQKVAEECVDVGYTFKIKIPTNKKG